MRIRNGAGAEVKALRESEGISLPEARNIVVNARIEQAIALYKGDEELKDILMCLHHEIMRK